MNQIDIPDYQCYVDCKTKRMVVLRFIQKNVSFSNGNIQKKVFSKSLLFLEI